MAEVTYKYTLISAFCDGLRPDPIITASEWANQYRILPSTSALPGRYNTRVTPYVAEILDRLSVHDPAQKVVVKKSSQTGFTETGCNWLGYVIDMAPAPFLFVMPTDTMVKLTSKNRIDTLIQTTPSVKKKVSSKKSKDSSNTLLHKDFLNGFVMLVGANSPNGLSSTAVRYVYLDEVDRYPFSVGGEGSAEALAKTRTITYGARKKIFLTSTPTKKGESAISEAFEATSQRFYHVPCPFCGQMQVLEIEQLRYGAENAGADFSKVTDPKYADAKYECVYCHGLIDERHKPKMMLAGEWRSKFPNRDDGITYGYFINALYAPPMWYTWGQMLFERDEAEGDVFKKIAFTNTKLGMEYEAEGGQKPDWEMLFNRYHNDVNVYEANKPFASVAFITAGVDVQADRLEVQLIGWAEHGISQVLDYRVLLGDTEKPEVWKELEKIINETWVREDNMELKIRMMAIDSGFNTSTVYKFVNSQPGNRVIATKGRDNLDIIFSPPRATTFTKQGKKIESAKVYSLGVSVLKGDIYGRLKQSIDIETGEIPANYCHILPMDSHYFQSLTAEELTPVINKKGHQTWAWIVKYKRNEVLDTFVYARAAASIIGMDRWKAAHWEAERKLAVAVEEKALPPVPKKKKKSIWETREL